MKVRVIKHEGRLNNGGFHYRFLGETGIIDIIERNEKTDEIIAIHIEGEHDREWMPLEALAPFCRLNRNKRK